MTKTPVTHAPDSPTLADDVPCPLCSYNLRGLADPHCPECGYSFPSFAALIESQRTTHPYLFEHHPRRNVRSFLLTALATSRPRRFWRSLSPAHAVRPRRLVVYWSLSSLPLALILVASLVANVSLHRQGWVRGYQQMLQSSAAAVPGTPAYDMWKDVIDRYGSAERYIAQYQPSWTRSLITMWADARPVLTLYVLWLLWPWATAAALLAYRRSMRQASIRPAHVGRCVLYSADLIWWPGLALLSYLTWSWGRFVWGNLRLGQSPFGSWIASPSWVFTCALWTGHALALTATYRLTVAYSQYLRFRHAWVAVPLASTASLLLLWLLFLAIAGENAIARLPL